MKGLEKKTLGKSGIEVPGLDLAAPRWAGCMVTSRKNRPTKLCAGHCPWASMSSIQRRCMAMGKVKFASAERCRAGAEVISCSQPRWGVCWFPKTREGDTSQDANWGTESPLRPKFDFSRDAVMRSVEESLKRLQTDRIDILHIHDPDNHYEQALRGAYLALDKLRSQGVIRAVSAGMNQSEMLARFAREGDFDCFLLAGRYSILEQGAMDELFPLCAQKNIGILLGGTYNSGILASDLSVGAKFNYADAPSEVLEKARGLQKVAARHRVSLKAAASQFALAHPQVTCIIPGTRVPDRVEENLKLVDEPIPSEFWAELKAENLIRQDAPVPS